MLTNISFRGVEPMTYWPNYNTPPKNGNKEEESLPVYNYDGDLIPGGKNPVRKYFNADGDFFVLDPGSQIYRSVDYDEYIKS